MTDSVGKLQRCTTGRRHQKKAADEFCLLGPHDDKTPHRFPTDDERVIAAAKQFINAGLVAIPQMGPGELQNVAGVWISPSGAEHLGLKVEELRDLKAAMQRLLAKKEPGS